MKSLSDFLNNYKDYHNYLVAYYSSRMTETLRSFNNPHEAADKIVERAVALADEVIKQCKKNEGIERSA